MKVLLADSSSSVQRAVEMALVERDVELIALDDGAEVLGKMAELQPDLVLADIELPSLDGYNLCDRIKADPETADTKVILLKPAFGSYDEEWANSVGADGMLEKPFKASELLKIVDWVGEQASMKRKPVKFGVSGKPAQKDDAVFEYMEQAVTREADGGDDEYSSFDSVEKALVQEGSSDEDEQAPPTYELEITDEEETPSEIFVISDRQDEKEEESRDEEEPPELPDTTVAAKPAAYAPPEEHVLSDDVSFADVSIGESPSDEAGIEMYVEGKPSPPAIAEESSEVPSAKEIEYTFEREAAEISGVATAEEEAGIAAEEEEIAPIPLETVGEDELAGVPGESYTPEKAGVRDEGAMFEPLELSREVELDIAAEERRTLGLSDRPSEEEVVEEPVLQRPEAATEITEEFVEKIIAQVLQRLGSTGAPSLDEETAAKAGEELLDKIVSRLSDKVVQEVAWEVVPDLAERMIREAIEEIKSS